MTADNVKKKVSYIIAFIFLALIIYCLIGFFVFLFFKFPKLFLSAGTNIKVAVISFIGTAIVSVLTIVISKHIEKEADFRRAQYQSKLETYKKFLDDFLATTLLDTAENNLKSNKDKQESIKLQKQMDAIRCFIKNVILWGSDEVIHSTSIWMFHLRTQNGDTDKIHASIQEMEELLKLIRKDLGHSNKKIQTGDILRMFINDYDETIGKNNTKNSAS